MAYPEGGDAGTEPLPSGGGYDYGNYGGEDLKTKLLKNFEGFIPLILIIIIGFFLLSRLNILTPEMPLIGPIVAIAGGQGDEPREMLIIGKSTPLTLNLLNQNRKLVRYDMRTAGELDRNPKEVLAQYNMVLFDQSTENDKTIPFEVAEALNEWVKKGGKLLIVQNSGTQRRGAFDVIGWEASFGAKFVPVSCEPGADNQPRCLKSIGVARGKIIAAKRNHRVMQGIEIAPAAPEQYYALELFDVGVEGGAQELAYFETFPDKKRFTAIVEAKSPISIGLGKVLYFNYDLGKSPGIFENTLRYLK